MNLLAPSCPGSKYTTSCWTIPLIESQFDSYYKKIDEQTDDIYSLKGTQVIFEYMMLVS